MMGKSEYKIVDDFQVLDRCRVSVLDSDYDFWAKHPKAIIDGKEYDFTLNHILRWITFKSPESFKGKTVKFVKTS